MTDIQKRCFNGAECTRGNCRYLHPAGVVARRRNFKRDYGEKRVYQLSESCGFGGIGGGGGLSPRSKREYEFGVEQIDTATKLLKSVVQDQRAVKTKYAHKKQQLETEYERLRKELADNYEHMRQDEQQKATKGAELAFKDRQQSLDYREQLIAEKEHALDTIQSQCVTEMLPSLIKLIQHPTFKDAARPTVQLCRICLEDDAISECMFECGHLCMCLKCSQNVKECPLCRHGGKIIKVYN